MKQTAYLICLLLFSFVITTSVVGQNQKRELGNNESIKSGQILYSQSGLLKLQFKNSSLAVMKKDTIIWQSKNWSLDPNKSKIDKLAFENGNINCSKPLRLLETGNEKQKKPPDLINERQ